MNRCVFALLVTAGAATAEPPEPRPGDVVVAIVGTGVDASQPGLAGVLLRGKSVSKDADAWKDESGSGTRAALAVVEIVAARPRHEGAGRVLLLPVRATPAGSDAATAEQVAQAVDTAVAERARVVCIALSAARGARRLDEALSAADRAGALVFADSGVGRETLELHPAAHPLVVSCARRDDTAVGFSFDSCTSGKTALAGSAAQASAIAALLLESRGDLTSLQARQWILMHGPRASCDEHDRTARIVSPKALDSLPRTPGTFGDLCIEDAWVDFGHARPGEEVRMRARLRNVGLQAVGGALEGSLESAEPCSVAFDPLQPGQTVTVAIALPACHEGRWRATMTLRCKSDVNPANDTWPVLLACSDRPAEPFVRRVLVGGLSRESAKVRVEGELVNPTSEPRTLEVAVRFTDAAFSKTVTVDARSVLPVGIEIDVPDPAGRWTEIPVLLFLKEKDRRLSFDGGLLRVDSHLFKP